MAFIDALLSIQFLLGLLLTMSFTCNGILSLNTNKVGGGVIIEFARVI